MSSSHFDLNIPESYNHQFIEFGEKKYHYVEQGPVDGQLVLLIHGFPESWYSWKYQIEYLSKLGYHVVAFDKPGYGETKVEDKLDNFTFKTVAEDIHYIFTQHFKQDKVMVIAHDWGSCVGWELAYRYPENIISYISISIPYTPGIGEPATERQKAEKSPILGYQVALGEGNVEQFDQDIEKFLKFFYPINKTEATKGKFFIPLNKGLFEHDDSFDNSGLKYPEDNLLDYLIGQYKIQGTKGPTNWYRTSYLNGLNDKQKPHHNITVKCLQILGTEDVILPFFEHVKGYLKDCKTEEVKGGHWIHYRNYEEVNAMIGSFLKESRL